MMGRALLGFLGLMAIGYLALVLLLPPPSDPSWRPDDMTGQSAAARLSQQAHFLAGHRESTALQ